MTENIDNPYYKPLVPKNSWELVKWVIFEPNRVEKYGKTLNIKNELITLLRSYLLIPFIATILWLSGLIFLSFADIPTFFWNTIQRIFNKIGHSMIHLLVNLFF